MAGGGEGGERRGGGGGGSRVVSIVSPTASGPAAAAPRPSAVVVEPFAEIGHQIHNTPTGGEAPEQRRRRYVGFHEEGTGAVAEEGGSGFLAKSMSPIDSSRAATTGTTSPRLTFSFNEPMFSFEEPPTFSFDTEPTTARMFSFDGIDCDDDTVDVETAERGEFESSSRSRHRNPYNCHPAELDSSDHSSHQHRHNHRRPYNSSATNRRQQTPGARGGGGHCRLASSPRADALASAWEDELSHVRAAADRLASKLWTAEETLAKGDDRLKSLRRESSLLRRENEELRMALAKSEESTVLRRENEELRMALANAEKKEKEREQRQRRQHQSFNNNGGGGGGSGIGGSNAARWVTPPKTRVSSSPMTRASSSSLGPPPPSGGQRRASSSLPPKNKNRRASSFGSSSSSGVSGGSRSRSFNVVAEPHHRASSFGEACSRSSSFGEVTLTRQDSGLEDKLRRTLEAELREEAERATFVSPTHTMEEEEDVTEATAEEEEDRSSDSSKASLDDEHAIAIERAARALRRAEEAEVRRSQSQLLQSSSSRPSSPLGVLGLGGGRLNEEQENIIAGVIHAPANDESLTNQAKEEKSRELEEKLRERENELEKARKELESIRENSVKALEGRVEELEGRLADKGAELEKTQKELASVKSNGEELEGRLCDKDAEIEEMQKELASARSNGKELEGRLCDKDAELEEMQKELASAMSNGTELKKRVDELKGLLDTKDAELADMNADLSTAVSDADMLETELDKTREELECIREGNGSVKGLKGRVYQLEGQLKELEGQLADKDDEADTLEIALQAAYKKAEETQEKLDAALDRNANLEEQLHRKEEAVELTEEKLKAALDCNVHLEGQLQRKDEVVTQHEEALQAEKTRAEELRKELEATKAGTAYCMEVLQERLDESEAALQSEKKKTEELSALVTQSEAALQTERRTTEELLREDPETTKVGTTASCIKELRKRLGAREAELWKEKEAAEELREELRTAETGAESRIKELERKLRESTAKAEEAEEKWVEAFCRNVGLENQLLTKDELISQSEMTLRAERTTTQELRATLENARSNAECLQNQLHEKDELMSQSVEALHTEKKAAVEFRVELEDAKLAAESRIQDLTEQLRESNCRNVDLETQLRGKDELVSRSEAMLRAEKKVAEELQKELEDAKTCAESRIQDLTEQLRESNCRNVGLETQLRGKGELVSQSEATLQAEKKVAEELREELEKARMGAESRIKDLAAKLHESHEKAEETEEKLKVALDCNIDLEDQLHRKDELVTQSEVTLRAEKNAVQELQEKLEAARMGAESRIEDLAEQLHESHEKAEETEEKLKTIHHHNVVLEDELHRKDELVSQSEATLREEKKATEGLQEELERARTGAQSRIRDLTEQLRESNCRNDGLETQLRGKDELVSQSEAALQAEKIATEELREELERARTGAESRIEELTEQLHESHEKVEKTEEKLKTALNHNVDLEDQLHRKDELVTQSEATLQAEKKVAEGLQEDLDKARTEAESRIEELEHGLNESNEKAEETEEKLKTALDRNIDLEDQLHRKDKLVTQSEAALQAEKKAAEELREELENARTGGESRIQDLMEQLNESHEKAEEAEEKLVAAEELQKELEAARMGAESRIEELEEKLNESHEKAEEAEEKLLAAEELQKELEAARTGAKSRIKDLTEKLHESHEKAEETEDKLVAAFCRNVGLENQLLGKDELVSQSKAALEAEKKTTQELREKMETARVGAEGRIEKLEEVQKDLDNIRATGAQLQGWVEELEGELGEKDAELADQRAELSVTVEKLHERDEHLSKAEASLKAERMTAEELREELETARVSAEFRIEELEEKLTEMNEEVADTVDDLETARAAAESRLRGYEIYLNARDASSVERKVAMDELQDELETAKIRMEELRADLNTSKLAFESRVRALEGDITEREEQIGRNALERNEMNSRLKGYEIYLHQRDEGLAESRVLTEELRKKLKAAETRAEELEVQLNAANLGLESRVRARALEEEGNITETRDEQQLGGESASDRHETKPPRLKGYEIYRYLRQREESLAENEAVTEELRTSLKRAETRADELVEELDATHRGSESRIGALEGTIAERDEELGRSILERDGMKCRLRGYEIYLNESDRSLAESKVATKELQDRLKVEETKAEELQVELNAANLGFESRVRALNEDLRQSILQREELKSRLKEYEINLNARDVSLAESKVVAEELQVQLEAAETKAEELRVELNSANLGFKCRIAGLNEELRQSILQRDELKSRLRGYEIYLQERDGSLRESKAVIEELQDKLKAEETRAEELKMELNKVNLGFESRFRALERETTERNEGLSRSASERARLQCRLRGYEIYLNVKDAILTENKAVMEELQEELEDAKIRAEHLESELNTANLGFESRFRALERQMTEKNEELGQSVSERDKLKCCLRGYEIYLNENDAIFTEIKATTKELQEQLEAAKTRAEHLETELNTVSLGFESRVRALERQLTEKTDELNRSLSERNEMKSRLEMHSNERDGSLAESDVITGEELQGSLNVMETRAEQLEVELDAANLRFESCVRALEGQLADGREQLSQKLSERDEMESRLEGYEVLLDERDGSSVENKLVTEVQQGSLEAAETRATQLEVELTTASLGFESRIRALEGQIAESNEKLSKSISESDKLRKGYEIYLNERERILARNKVVTEKLRGSLEAAGARAEAMEIELNAANLGFESRVKVLEGKLAEGKEQLGQNISKRNELETSLDATKLKMEELEKDLACAAEDAERLVRDCNAQLHSKNEELSESKAKIEELTSLAEARTTKANELERDMAECRESLGSRIRELEEQLIQKEGHVAKLDSKKKELENATVAARGDLEYIKRQLQERSEQIKTLESFAADKDLAIESLSAKLASVEHELALSTDKIDTLKGTLVENTLRLEANHFEKEAIIASQLSQLEVAKNNLAAVAKEKDALELAIQILHEDQAEKQSVISDMESTLNDQRDIIVKLEVDVAEKNDVIEMLRERAESTASNFSKLENRRRNQATKQKAICWADEERTEQRARDQIMEGSPESPQNNGAVVIQSGAVRTIGERELVTTPIPREVLASVGLPSPTYGVPTSVGLQQIHAGYDGDEASLSPPWMVSTLGTATMCLPAFTPLGDAAVPRAVGRSGNNGENGAAAASAAPQRVATARTAGTKSSRRRRRGPMPEDGPSQCGAASTGERRRRGDDLACITPASLASVGTSAPVKELVAAAASAPAAGDGASAAAPAAALATSADAAVVAPAVVKGAKIAEPERHTAAAVSPLAERALSDGPARANAEALAREPVAEEDNEADKASLGDEAPTAPSCARHSLFCDATGDGRSAFVPYHTPHSRHHNFPPPSPIPSLLLTPIQKKDSATAAESLRAELEAVRASVARGGENAKARIQALEETLTSQEEHTRKAAVQKREGDGDQGSRGTHHEYCTKALVLEKKQKGLKDEIQRCEQKLETAKNGCEDGCEDELKGIEDRYQKRLARLRMELTKVKEAALVKTELAAHQARTKEAEHEFLVLSPRGECQDLDGDSQLMPKLDHGAEAELEQTREESSRVDQSAEPVKECCDVTISAGNEGQKAGVAKAMQAKGDIGVICRGKEESNTGAVLENQCSGIYLEVLAMLELDAPEAHLGETREESSGVKESADATKECPDAMILTEIKKSKANAMEAMHEKDNLCVFDHRKVAQDLKVENCTETGLRNSCIMQLWGVGILVRGISRVFNRKRVEEKTSKVLLIPAVVASLDDGMVGPAAAQSRGDKKVVFDIRRSILLTRVSHVFDRNRIESSNTTQILPSSAALVENIQSLEGVAQPMEQTFGRKKVFHIPFWSILVRGFSQTFDRKRMEGKTLPSNTPVARVQNEEILPKAENTATELKSQLRAHLWDVTRWSIFVREIIHTFSWRKRMENETRFLPDTIMHNCNQQQSTAPRERSVREELMLFMYWI